MRILGIDVETTGLDTKEDRIIEIGAVVWDIKEGVPLEMYSSFVLPSAKLPLPAEITKITGIKEEWLQSHGRKVGDVLTRVGFLIDDFKVSHVVAHNGENYDKPLICSELDRAGLKDHPLKVLPWIDTRMDLPFDEEPISRRLNHLALDHGFINPFKHRALFDVLTMLRVMSHYDFTKVLEQTQIPWCTMRALVSYDDREKAKELRYSWEKIGDKTYPKWWVKRVRENKVEAEMAAAAAKNFKAVRIE